MVDSLLAWAILRRKRSFAESPVWGMGKPFSAGQNGRGSWLQPKYFVGVMGILLAIVIFGVCFLYPPYSILKSKDVGISKTKWAAIAFCSPVGLLLIPYIAERLVSTPITSADIAVGWVGSMRSIGNILALLVPWGVLFAYEKRRKAASEALPVDRETQSSE